MIKDSLVAIGTTARALARNWRALAVFNLLYVALLVTIYMFVSTKEATTGQLILTALLALAAPILFFTLQAAGVWYTQMEVGASALMRRALKDFWKLLLISLPLIALAVLVMYALNKLQARFPVEASHEATHPALMSTSQGSPPAPMRWPDVVFPSLRLLLLGVALPLTAIHLWIALIQRGFKTTLKTIHQVLARAFSAPSVLIYAVGLFLFALMPYFLIFTRTPVANAWGELIIFGARLALAFIFTLWGWIITLGALAKTSAGAEAMIDTQTSEVTPPSGDESPAPAL